MAMMAKKLSLLVSVKKKAWAGLAVAKSPARKMNPRRDERCMTAKLDVRVSIRRNLPNFPVICG